MITINLLFDNNIYLVRKIVRRMNYGYLEEEDLMQVGLMGLYQATLKYNSNLNTSFSKFATYYIIGEIKKELRENQTIKLSKEMYRIIRFIKEESYSSKTIIEETQKSLNVSKENVILALNYMDRVFSLNCKVVDDEELLDIVSSIKVNDNSDLSEALKVLNDNEKRIIRLHFYEDYNQKEIANLYKVNQSQISRIIKKSLNKMRNFIKYNCNQS